MVIISARDELELLEAQLNVKRAELGETLARLKQARRNLRRLETAAAQGAIPEREVTNARDEVERAQTQLSSKQAMVKESEVRLAQAKRHLEKLQRANASGKVTETGQLLDLEKKLDAILLQVERLHTEIRLLRPVPKERPEKNDDTVSVDHREFSIPFLLERSAINRVKKVLLYCSTNEGQTWEEVAEAGPKEQQFRFTAPQDGVYWFAVRIVQENGQSDPQELNKSVKPGIKVRVRTTN